jgi:uncharacterized protein (TIGR03663 family)
MEQEIKAPASWLDRPITSVLAKVDVQAIIIVVILGLAILSRLYNLGDRVMSHDETNHVVPSWELFTGAGYRYDPVTHGPLQFHLIALSFFFFGDNDFTARLPAALFSIAAIAIVLLAYRRYLGRHGALIAGFLFLISPYMLFYGRYTRNEGFSPVWGVVTILAALRYLEKGDRFSLILLTLVSAFHFVDKATSFIYTAQLMIFLFLLFLQELSRIKWPLDGIRKQFIILMGGAAVAFTVALGLGVWNSAINKTPATTTAASPAPAAAAITLSPQMYGIFAALGIAVILALAGIVILIRNLGWNAIRRQRSCDLLILLGTLVLPQLSAFPLRMLGLDPLDYSTLGMLRSGTIIIILTLIAVAVGLWWNPKLWLTLAAIFYGIFTVFFTTFFTNGQGFFTGLVGALGYWLAQQSVQRGSQPLYYYVLVQIPIYEYLAALGTILALYFGVRHSLFTTVPGYDPAHQPDLPESGPEKTDGSVNIVDVDTDELSATNGLSVEQGGDENDVSKRIPILALILYWSLTSVVAFSLAGEKMPWLMVHIVTPMILAAGWGLGYLVDTTPWKEIFNRKGLLAILLMPVFLTSLASLLGTILGNHPPFQGNTLDQLQASSTFLLSAVVFILSGYGILRLLKDFAGMQVARLLVLISFVLMAVLTARTAYTAAFINYNTALEYLVYAHAASGPKEILAQIEQISQRTTRGNDLVVAYDNDSLYPFWWYLRDYPNHVWFQDNPTRDLANDPVILAGENNYAKLEPIVKNNYVSFEYNRLWWPNQDYFDLTWQRIVFAITNPDMRAAIFNIWLNRDYTMYAKITNNSTMTLENWQPSNRMRMYIRKDIIAEMWNYGATPATNQTVQTDPYEKNMAALTSDASFGSAGAAGGQFQSPHQIAFAPDGTMYVADGRNNRIQHLTATGQVLQVWGSFADSSKGNAAGGTFNEPWGVAVGPDGSVFVTDTWNHRIQKFTADGKFVKEWGHFGQADTPDAFWGPRGLAFDSKGRLYVTDTGNKRIAIFDENGNFIAQFGSAGLDPGQFDEPVGVAVDAQGNVYVADTWNQRVQVFAPDATGTNYTPLTSWDINGWFGQSLDNKPFIAVDANDNVYVTDPEGYRVLEFDKTGKFIRGWDNTANGGAGLGLPSGIAIDSSGHVWVSDAGNNDLLRFTMPAQ